MKRGIPPFETDEQHKNERINKDDAETLKHSALHFRRYAPLSRNPLYKAETKGEAAYPDKTGNFALLSRNRTGAHGLNEIYPPTIVGHGPKGARVRRNCIQGTPSFCDVECSNFQYFTGMVGVITSAPILIRGERIDWPARGPQAICTILLHDRETK